MRLVKISHWNYKTLSKNNYNEHNYNNTNTKITKIITGLSPSRYDEREKKNRQKKRYFPWSHYAQSPSSLHVGRSKTFSEVFMHCAFPLSTGPAKDLTRYVVRTAMNLVMGGGGGRGGVGEGVEGLWTLLSLPPRKKKSRRKYINTLIYSVISPLFLFFPAFLATTSSPLTSLFH